MVLSIVYNSELKKDLQWKRNIRMIMGWVVTGLNLSMELQPCHTVSITCNRNIYI